MEYPKTSNVTLLCGGTLAVGTSIIVAMKAPTDALGGGFTVVEACYSSGSAIAAGSAPIADLVLLGTGGALAGTIGTIAAGAFSAGTPRCFGLTSTVFVDAGQYVGWQLKGTAANANALWLTGFLNYVPGK
jgi:hypothetical protein